MRTPTCARWASIAGRATLVVALLASGGCSMLRASVGAYETGALGIARPQERFREALAHGDFTTALGWHEDDALLQALNTGAARYYALQFAGSAAVLDSAALIADDRITTSVSRNALSLVTNDMARDYTPRRTERLFIPYYGMLSYARLGQWEDAAVEARRLAALLSAYAADRGDGERVTHATMHYLAATVFERAGNAGEARVEYRLARALAPDMVDSAAAAPLAGNGDVLVVVERGFVAHRTTEALNVFVGDADDDSARTSRGQRDRRHRSRHDADDDDYWLSVAFPSVRKSPRAAGEPQLLVDQRELPVTRVGTVVDDAVIADESRERVALVARAVARATAKYAVTKAVKDRKGEVAGAIVNIGASLLERADIRSWHVLPQEITLLRVRAPAGRHEVSVLAGNGERIDLDPVTVRPGELSFATVRVWTDARGHDVRTLAQR